MKLVKYRDAGLPTYTYFWISEDDKVLSPYFNSEKEATDWVETQKEKLISQPRDS